MIENKEVMAKNIRFYMDKKGVNATEVCNALGFKGNTFSDWVNAKTYPRIDKIEKMANYFNVSKSALVEDMRYDVDYISPDERILIECFRKSDNDTQSVIRRLLAYEKELKE